MIRAHFNFLIAGLLLLQPAAYAVESPAASKATTGQKIHWQTWTDDLFERAQKEKKFVVLDLEAVWCHWCHVMDEKTYADPKVAKLIGSRFIAVRVDQDSRPDLSNRYEDYGWPATIFFNSDGTELVKRAGFIPPDEMASLLEAIIKDPTPGPSAQKAKPVTYTSATALTPALRKELQENNTKGYDTKYGSWGTYQKFLDWDSVELALENGRRGDAQAAQRARFTLDQQLNLLDPVWGGVYQYSTHGDWEHPHFEKIMQMQGENLRAYALGYSQFRDPKHLQAAEAIYKYLTTILMSPSGAFYTSQDADIEKGKHSDWYFKLSDAERRKHGIPRIDTNIYARENGWAINGIVQLYMATGDKKYLDTAVKAADWIIANRSLPGGGFSHDAKDVAGPYLGDTLYMGRAMLSLYAATGDRNWLKKAEEAAQFIAKNFEHKSGGTNVGFNTVAAKTGSIIAGEPLLDENVNLARFTNLLYRYTGNKQYRGMAETAMRFLATPEVAHRRRIMVAGILLADQELSGEPIHITVVGGKKDASAQALFIEALRYPNSYKVVEWFDKAEGPLPNSEVEFPDLPVAAAFGCANQRCSLPIKKPADIARTIDAFTKSE